MTIVHIVAFKTASPESLSLLTDNFLALADICVKPGPGGGKYIRSVRGGKQTSPEGHDGGMQVVFVVEFESKADLDYYLDHDPAHDAFKKAVGETFEGRGVTVLDFVDGEFA